MNIQPVVAFFTLIKEVLRQPGIKKYNTKKNQLRNILLMCFLIMFLGFMVMTEQAILQSTAKYALQENIAQLEKQVAELKLDLYVKRLSEAPPPDQPN